MTVVFFFFLFFLRECTLYVMCNLVMTDECMGLLASHAYHPMQRAQLLQNASYLPLRRTTVLLGP